MIGANDDAMIWRIHLSVLHFWLFQDIAGTVGDLIIKNSPGLWNMKPICAVCWLCLRQCVFHCMVQRATYPPNPSQNAACSGFSCYKIFGVFSCMRFWQLFLAASKPKVLNLDQPDLQTFPLNRNTPISCSRQRVWDWASKAAPFV